MSLRLLGPSSPNMLLIAIWNDLPEPHVSLVVIVSEAMVNDATLVVSRCLRVLQFHSAPSPPPQTILRPAASDVSYAILMVFVLTQ